MGKKEREDGGGGGGVDGGSFEMQNSLQYQAPLKISLPKLLKHFEQNNIKA